MLGQLGPRRHLSLDGAVVLLTGASGGVGADLAHRLSKQGARVTLVARSVDRLTSVVAGLGGPDRALAACADVRDLASLELAATRTVAHFGRLDVAVAAAGTDTAGSVEDMDPSAFERDIDTNLSGVWRTLRAALPYVRRTRGHLVAVSSLAAFIHSPLQSSYAASKAGVTALCDSLRLELAGTGVTVGTVHPTFFDSPMQRLLRSNDALTAAWGGYRGMFTPVRRAEVVDAVVRSIRRRQRTTVVPRRYGAVPLFPGVVQAATEAGPLRPRPPRTARGPGQHHQPAGW